MLGAKQWYLSKSVWGSIAVIVGLILDKSGIGVSQEEMDLAIDNLIGAISAVLQFAGVILAIYGRLNAKKVLK